MPNWLIKSAIHRTISWLPNSQFWNGLFQKWITKSTTLTPKMFEDKLRECARLLGGFTTFSPGARDFTVLEIGTGWFPTIPAGLFLCGAREIWTTDIDPLLSRERLARMLELYRGVHERGQLAKLLPGLIPERVSALLALSGQAGTPAELLEKINIHVLVRDARETRLPAGSIDFFFSSGVLEYIPVPVLQGILAEARRLASPRFVTTHRLNLVDQYSYFDSAITPFNFLKFSPAQWHWANSPLIWQNRLRISDFRRLFQEAGFEILREENESGSAEDLRKVRLSPEFQGHAEADLLVLHSFVTANVAAAAHRAAASQP